MINVGKIKKFFIFDCDLREDDRNCNGMKNPKNVKNLNGEFNGYSYRMYILLELDYFIGTIKKKRCYKAF